MNEQLNEMLRQLHNARTDATSAKLEMNTILDAAKESADYRRESLVRELAEKDIETLEEKIREYGIGAYLGTGNKTVNEFVKIREEKVFTVTDPDAMRAFIENRLPDALIVDEKKVKNYAIKIGPVDGTTVTVEPKVTIATDLSGVSNVQA